jgi:hypothetical protein
VHALQTSTLLVLEYELLLRGYWSTC